MECLCTRFTRTSVGRKFIMAITGLGAIGFILGHLCGNLLLFFGPEAFNAYAALLHSKPAAIAVAEAGLFVLFSVHVVVGIVLTLQNMQARDISYDVDAYSGKSTFASRTMIYSGIFTLLFMIMHIITIKLTYIYHGNLASYSAYERVLVLFSDPLVAASYAAGVISVGIHLYHGAQSTLQSLGFKHPNYECLIVKGGRTLACVVTVAFAAMPLWLWLNQDHSAQQLEQWKIKHPPHSRILQKGEIT